MKKYASLSILINIILGSIYAYGFHFRKPFQVHDAIKVSLAEANANISEANDRLVDDVSYVLRKKPKLKSVIDNHFDCVNDKRDSFFVKIDDLIRNEKIPNTEFYNVIMKQQRFKQLLFEMYGKTLKGAQKEAKLKDREVREKIENFRDIIYKENEWGSLLNSKIGLKDRLLVLQGTKAEINSLEYLINHDMANYTARRGCDFYFRHFPIAFAPRHTIKKGDKFHAEIHIGMFTSKIEDFAIYFDGNKLNNKNGDIPAIELKAEKEGWQKHEAIVFWKDALSHKILSDTTNAEFLIHK